MPCKATLAFLSYEVESISHVVNLGCLVICLDQEDVAIPGLSFRGPGALYSVSRNLIKP